MRKALFRLATLLLLTAAPPALANERVTAAYGAVSTYNAPIWIAKEQGLFAKYGLDVELVQLVGARITAGLVSNSVQFISSSASSPFLSVLAGGDAVLVGTLLNKLPYDFIVNPAKIADLSKVKGHVGAMALHGDIAEGALRIIVAAQGLDPDRDVTLLQGFGTDAERLAAMVSGSVDFTVMNADYRDAYQKAGFRRLTSAMDVKGADFMLSGIFTRRDYAKAHPDAVSAYLKAMTAALQVMRNDPETALRIVSKYQTRPAAEIAPQYEFYHALMQSKPLLDADLVRSCLGVLATINAEAPKADPRRFFDASFVDALDSAGALDAIVKAGGR